MSLVGRIPLPSLATRRRVGQLAARALLSTISGSASAAAAASVSAAALAPDEHQHHPHLLRHHTNSNDAETSQDANTTANAVPRADKDKRKDQQVLAQEFAKPRADVTFLVNNYTAPALAAAYQDREYTLRLCAELLSEGKLDELKAVLTPYHDFSLQERSAKRLTALSDAFGARHLERIRKRLSRLPRQITKAYTQRAAVVIPLCTFNGEPSVLFTLRSLTVGKHKGEVCFPGGMVDESDSCIEATCLREMEEEVGLHSEVVDVLGILRCDWSSVTSITGIAVTPVVGFIGEMRDQSVVINENEVEQLFTVSLRDLMDPDNWIRRENATPVFTGGPHVVWGLTAYLLDICLSEVLLIAQGDGTVAGNSEATG